MERDSFLYKARRKGQCLAHRFLADEMLAKFYYRIILKKSLNLEHPHTFNEKIQWMKLYYYPKNDLVIRCTDKHEVRGYVTDKGLKDILVPLIGVWDAAEEIRWEDLPGEFVLKCNHGCAYNILVPDKDKADKKAISKRLNKWLKEDFGSFNIELHYSEIKRHRIICEEFLGDSIIDYKFFCFHGKPEFIYVSTDLIHDRQAKIGFFYLDGSKMPLHRDDYEDIPGIEMPGFFQDMLEDTKALCKDFPFVRVDFFIANGRYYFAELTFTPGAGMMPFNPEKYDLEWGGMIDIPKNKRDG